MCGAGSDMRIARAALHFWEEPPLSGTSGSGAVFFAYCPLRCVYCQNAQLAAGEAGVEVSVDRLAQICLELQEKGALNINMVTPTHYAPAICEAVAKAREAGLQLPIVWNTSGYETVDAVRALDGTVDVFLADCKYADAKLAETYSHAPDYPEVAARAIDEMLKVAGPVRFDEYRGQKRMTSGVIVRHLLLPDALENSKAVVRLVAERWSDDVALSLMNQYTPLLVTRAQGGDAQAAATLARFPELGQTVDDAVYEELLDYADDLGLDYFWQVGAACEESFIPAWDNTGVLGE